MSRQPSSSGAGSSPDSILSEAELRRICLKSLDRRVYNDLPQYLIQVDDMAHMRLCSRDEVREHFLPKVESMPINMWQAIRTRDRWNYDGDVRKLCEAQVKDLLRFAIFSHRWGSREPSFRDMSSKIYGHRQSPTGPGFDKLLNFCKKAKEYGCKYVWTDTCCINKESSAELEEAIRSMYRWYKDAFVCIVYLARSSTVDDFFEEPWFTRGWTLQELLAPSNLRMYGKDWTPLCPLEENIFTSPLRHHHLSLDQRPFPTRSQPDQFPNDKQNNYMLNAISKSTGIDAKYIREFTTTEVPLSEKMRWASKRETTRVEDKAYCLLGIFNVSMPIAYGEGTAAFRRLLDVIAQQSQDPTFFAWAGRCSLYSIALPYSPGSFNTQITVSGGGDRAYTIQKLGVQVKLLLIRMQVYESNLCYKLEPLNQDLAPVITVSTPLWRRPNVFTGDQCTLGVVNFDRQPRDGDGDGDSGFLLAGKQYFCMLMKSPLVSFPSTFGKPSVRLDTGDVLPMIKCKMDYGALPTTVCLLHTLDTM